MKFAINDTIVWDNGEIYTIANVSKTAYHLYDDEMLDVGIHARWWVERHARKITKLERALK